MTKILSHIGTLLICSAGAAPTVMAQGDEFEVTLEVLDDVSDIEGVMLSLEDALEIAGSVSDTTDSDAAADRAFDDEVESAEENDDDFDIDLDDDIDGELEDGGLEQLERDSEPDPETELDRMTEIAWSCGRRTPYVGMPSGGVDLAAAFRDLGGQRRAIAARPSSS